MTSLNGEHKDVVADVETSVQYIVGLASEHQCMVGYLPSYVVTPVTTYLEQLGLWLFRRLGMRTQIHGSDL